MEQLVVPLKLSLMNDDGLKGYFYEYEFVLSTISKLLQRKRSSSRVGPRCVIWGLDALYHRNHIYYGIANAGLERKRRKGPVDSLYLEQRLH